MLKQFLFIILFIILLFVVVYFFQRHFIYFPSKEVPDRMVFHAEDMQQIELTTTDGIILNSWYKPAAENKPTILYFHGNAGHIGHRMYLIRQFLSEGFGVFLLEYRGYAGNKGQPSEKGFYEDGRAAISFLFRQHIESRRIVLYGESIGTGVAVQVASKFPVCALVLQAPFTSLAALSRYHYPWIMVPLQDKFDSLSRIHKIKVPLLVLHGEQDTIVPYTQGQALFHSANEPKRWIGFSQKGHNDLWDTFFSKEVSQFIYTHCF